MGNAGRNGGEYYTPRPLIRAIVKVAHPKLGERIYDGAVGSAGFLCEAYDYLTANNPKRTTAQDRALQERTFYGNPNGGEEVTHRTPAVIMKEIAALDAESAEVLRNIRTLL